MHRALPDNEFQNSDWLVDDVSKAPERLLVAFLPGKREFTINASDLGTPPKVMTSTLAEWRRAAACRKAREIMDRGA